MYSCVPGKPLGKNVNHSYAVWVQPCIPGKPLGKLSLQTCEPLLFNLYATLRSREASGQGLHCMLILHLGLD